MLVALTVCVTLVLTTEPRYYVMILPFLMLGWVLLLRIIGERFGGKWCDLIPLAGCIFTVRMNIGKIVPFVIEQERVPFYESGMRFYEHYRGGKFMPVIDLAEMIHEKVPPGAKVITPSAQIVRYLSDREVLMERELFASKRGARRYPEHLAALHIAYAAFPGKIYQDKEPTLAQLFKHGVIQPSSTIGRVDDIRLASATITVPNGDWQTQNLAAPVTRPATRPTTHRSTTRHPPRSKPAPAAKRRAAQQQAAKKRRLERAAATQPSKMKKKHPTSQPTTQPATQP